MPIDKSKYPKNWNEIAKRVKDAAGWKCVACGVGHLEDKTMGSCLTVHHPNRDTWNDGAEMVALCARCHLKADRELRNMDDEVKQGEIIKSE